MTDRGPDFGSVGGVRVVDSLSRMTSEVETTVRRGVEEIVRIYSSEIERAKYAAEEREDGLRREIAGKEREIRDLSKRVSDLESALSRARGKESEPNAE
jgi:hypothetical protein